MGLFLYLEITAMSRPNLTHHKGTLQPLKALKSIDSHPK
jgi:hypothetical protein